MKPLFSFMYDQKPFASSETTNLPTAAKWSKTKHDGAFFSNQSVTMDAETCTQLQALGIKVEVLGNIADGRYEIHWGKVVVVGEVTKGCLKVITCR